MPLEAGEDESHEGHCDIPSNEPRGGIRDFCLGLKFMSIINETTDDDSDMSRTSGLENNVARMHTWNIYLGSHARVVAFRFSVRKGNA